MAKKQDAFYFESFVASVDCACQAAAILDETLRNFHPQELPERIKVIHEVEHAADCKKHALMQVLAKAFITPIEREDIILLSQNIDDLVDKIEDVLIRLYCNNVQTIRPDALQTSALIVKGCSAVKAVMEEFADFKRSKNLRKHIIEVNDLEEEADKLFFSSIRQLHVNSTDPMEVFCWHELYRYLEHCMDTCEHVADIVESVVMKNS